MRTGALTFRIDSRLEHVALVGVAVRAICAAIPLDDDEAASVELCVVEAVNNAIEHAYAEAGQPVEVDLVLSNDALDITVRDRGRHMDWPRACADADAYAADALCEGGRGLFIMRSLMDRVSYRSAGQWNELAMHKRLVSLPDTNQLRVPSQP
jgi:serine/threonine-protein kinase RsbW